MPHRYQCKKTRKNNCENLHGFHKKDKVEEFSIIHYNLRILKKLLGTPCEKLFDTSERGIKPS